MDSNPISGTPLPKTSAGSSIAPRWSILVAGILLAVIAVDLLTHHAFFPRGLMPASLLAVLTIATILIIRHLFGRLTKLTRLNDPSADSSSVSAEQPSLLRAALKRGSPTWGLVFILTWFATGSLVPSTAMPVWLTTVVALLPMVPGFMFLRSVYRVPKEEDELVAHIWREACTFAFVALLGVFLSVTMLEEAGVLKNFAWDNRGMGVLWLALLCTGAAVSSRRYN